MRYTLQKASFKAIVKIEKSLLSTIYSKWNTSKAASTLGYLKRLLGPLGK